MVKIMQVLFCESRKKPTYECNNNGSKLTSKPKRGRGETAEMTAAAAASASKLGCVSKSALNC